MGYSEGMSTIDTIRYTPSYIYARFSGQFFFKFSYKKDCNEKKKDRCAMFGCNNDRLFPEKYTVKFCLYPKKRA